MDRMGTPQKVTKRPLKNEEGSWKMENDMFFEMAPLFKGHALLGGGFKHL